jgi:hypothetical protein
MVKKRGFNDSVTVEEGALIEAQETQDSIPHAEEEDPDYANLLGTVQEIKKRPEIFGYILKGDAKATVDLNDPTKIIEYAMLSSQAFESSETLAAAFSLGVAENVLVEGKTLKALCMDLGQNKISIFMEKTANHAELLRAFTPQPE